MDCRVANAVFDLLHAHRVSLFAHSCVPLNLLAIRTRFAPSVRKSAPRNDVSVILSDSEGSQTPHPVFRFSAKAQNRKQTSPSRGEVKKVAFTLAEVLITLGIIGVVAALTLPSLITKYQKQAAVNQLKVAYSILYNAFTMATIEHGNVDDWTFFQENIDRQESSIEFVKKYLQPYIKNVEVYNSSGSYLLKGCKNVTYKNMNGSVRQCNSTVAFCETCKSGGGPIMTYLYMANGSIVAVLTRYDWFAEIFIDTNGYKGPNTWGKDVFRLKLRKPAISSRVCSMYGLSIPFGNICHSRDWSIEQGCNQNSQSACGEIIIYDGWQIKDDYPW